MNSSKNSGKQINSLPGSKDPTENSVAAVCLISLEAGELIRYLEPGDELIGPCDKVKVSALDAGVDY